MAEKMGSVLSTHTARVVTREEITRTVSEQLKAQPEDTAISFIISPIAAKEEISAVLTKMASVAADKECNGNVWTPVGQEVRTSPQ